MQQWGRNGGSNELGQEKKDLVSKEEENIESEMAEKWTQMNLAELEL